MKNIILPNKELRLLSIQLQNFNSGYTVQQIRSLNNVVTAIEIVLKPFEDKLDEISRVIVSQVNEEEKQKDQAKKDAEIDDFFKTEGVKLVTCTLQDPDFEFIKIIWSRMNTLSGSKPAREAIIAIDNAIKSTTEPVFSNGEANLNPVDQPLTN